jgi:hypothetical protein
VAGGEARSLSGLATTWIAVIRPPATTVATAAIGFPPAVTSIPGPPLISAASIVRPDAPISI